MDNPWYNYTENSNSTFKIMVNLAITLTEWHEFCIQLSQLCVRFVAPETSAFTCVRPVTCSIRCAHLWIRRDKIK